MHEQAGLRVAVVGGGIGGLAAALFLHRAGVQVQVYEQMPRLRELGAGIVVAPNMVRPLARLGLLPGLQAFAPRLEQAWEFRRWQDGQVLSTQDMGQTCLDMYGAHCYVAHRGELLNLLRQALPDQTVRLGHKLQRLQQRAGGVTLHFGGEAGQELRAEADVVIGADGIHSAMRGLLQATDAPRFSGLCAFRCLVPAEAAPALALRPVQTLWLGPGRHFVHYPISAGRIVNVVAIVPAEGWRDESWTAPGSVSDMAASFEGWDPHVGQLIASARETRRWALFDREPLAQWTQGRVTLLGDAAHPMLPFLAQGSAQAVEDAEALGGALKGVDRERAPAALLAYEASRRPRATQVQLMSRNRELRNHLPDGPEQRRRDIELAAGQPLQQSAWLYGQS